MPTGTSEFNARPGGPNLKPHYVDPTSGPGEFTLDAIRANRQAVERHDVSPLRYLSKHGLAPGPRIRGLGRRTGDSTNGRIDPDETDHLIGLWIEVELGRQGSSSTDGGPRNEIIGALNRRRSEIRDSQ